MSDSLSKYFSETLFTKISASLCLIFALIAFKIAEKGLLTSWQTAEYSHGYFIPIIALFIGSHKLAEKHPSISPSWWGAFALIAAAGLALISRLSAFNMTEQYGLILALVGISLACLGKKPTQVMAPAFIYLIFAIPLPHLIQADLSQRLQLLSSTLGVWPLDAMGIPVFQEGNVIDLGGFKLQVVEACSGLRYLFPLMSFGYLVALLLKDRMWKKVVLFLSTIPISIILNSLRITFIGITVDLWGAGMAEGFIHDFEGWVVFLICLIFLMLETRLLIKIGNQRGHFMYEYVSIPKGPFFDGNNAKKLPVYAALIILAVMSLTFSLGRVGQSPEIIPSHPPFASFPTQLGDWKGRQDRLTPDVLSALQLSDYWLADYSEGQNQVPVNLYIAYYDSQRVGVTTHSPSNCIPGGGWQIAHSEIVPVQLTDGTALQVTRIIIRKDHLAELVYYWFDERGRDMPETYYAKWYLLLDSMRMNRSDGALVRIMVPLADANNEDAGDQDLHNFLDQAYPAIKAFIPGAIIGKITRH